MAARRRRAESRDRRRRGGPARGVSRRNALLRAEGAGREETLGRGSPGWPLFWVLRPYRDRQESALRVDSAHCHYRRSKPLGSKREDQVNRFSKTTGAWPQGQARRRSLPLGVSSAIHTGQVSSAHTGQVSSADCRLRRDRGGLALIAAANWFGRDAMLTTGLFVGALFLYSAVETFRRRAAGIRAGC